MESSTLLTRQFDDLESRGSQMNALLSINQRGVFCITTLNSALTQSLVFDVANGSQNFQPNVYIGNHELTVFQMGTGHGVSVSYGIFGADILAWAGQTEQLTFSAPYDGLLLYDISFSPTEVVPGPTLAALAGIGGVLFAACRRISPKTEMKSGTRRTAAPTRRSAKP
jgi:hypothetical protein